MEDIKYHNYYINYLIQKYNYQSYLEIGVLRGNSFDSINCLNKESCDITDEWWENDYPITYVMSSDEMFARMPIDKKYDCIFCDGYHSEEYLYRDIINSLKHLNKGGMVLCHDVVPKTVQNTMELPLSEISSWTGSCWKALTKLQEQNIEYYTLLNKDFGLGIILYKDNPQQLYLSTEKSKLEYSYVFGDNHIKFSDDINYLPNITNQGKYAMHLITEEEFFNMFNENKK